MEKIMLNIKGVQEVDGEKDVTEFMSSGSIYEEDGSVVITYSDSVSLGIDGVETKLSVSPNKTVTLLRNNGKLGNLIIEEGKRHLCRYATEYGDIMIGINGEKVCDNLKADGILKLQYSIDVNSGLLSRNQVEISIREEI